MYHVTILESHVILSAHVFNPNTFVRNFVSVRVTVVSVSLDAVARLSATQNNVHASWPYESVTQISALNVAPIRWIYPQ